MPCPYECWVKSACHAKRDDRHKFKYNDKPAATAARSQETGPAATNSNACESAGLTSWRAGAQRAAPLPIQPQQAGETIAYGQAGGRYASFGGSVWDCGTGLP